MTLPIDDPWIRRFHDGSNARVTLVCFPHAGGSAGFFHPVSRALQASLQVLAVQYPGRQDRRLERPLTTIAGLADGAYGALRPLMDRPLAFFGHSMGATVAFEVARRMRDERGSAPVTLFASGRRAPSRHRDEAVHERDDEGLVAELRTLSGTDPRMLGDPELLQMILPAIRSDYTAVETYRWQPGPPLDCPVVVLTGDRDPRVSPEEAQAWSEHTTGACTLRTFSGGHFYLTEHQDAVINLLSDHLLAPAL
jgi:surfactin synthase thioesterase subunit